MKIIPSKCRKCGGDTKIKWTEEISRFKMINKTGLKQTCIECGFSEFIPDLEDCKKLLNSINKYEKHNKRVVRNT